MFDRHFNSHRTATSTLALTAFALLAGATASPARAAAPAGSDAAAAAARADIGKTLGFVPQFFLRFPDPVLPGAWEEMKTLQLNPATALPPKVKELIGLAVSAQIPCRYCITAHTEFAKLGGATEREIGEAVGMAAVTRHWSTYLNGIQMDETKFRAEIAAIVDNAKRASAAGGGAGSRPAAAPAPAPVTDGASALAEINRTLGTAPEFLRRFPDVARAGAWREMRDLQLSPTTALPGKYKELVGLAVSAQIPCRYCVIAHTELAKLGGATEAEINEAIAMAALTRNLSTMLNGLEVDEPQFRRDVEKIVAGARAAAKRPRTTAAR